MVNRFYKWNLANSSYREDDVLGVLFYSGWKDEKWIKRNIGKFEVVFEDDLDLNYDGDYFSNVLIVKEHDLENFLKRYFGNVARRFWQYDKKLDELHIYRNGICGDYVIVKRICF